MSLQTLMFKGNTCISSRRLLRMQIALPVAGAPKQRILTAIVIAFLSFNFFLPPLFAGVIFQDNFETRESMVDFGRYFEYDDDEGDFVVLDGVGVKGSRGLRALFQEGEVDAGHLGIAFGKVPIPYLDKGLFPGGHFREIYVRFDMKLEPGWQGYPDKLARATILTDGNWSQAMIAHLWGSGDGFLMIDPVRAINDRGEVQTKGYNDFDHMKWLGQMKGTTPVFTDAYIGEWVCIEMGVKLNDPGKGNGVFDFWVNGNLEVKSPYYDFVRFYDDYGINVVFIENYWNKGSPKKQARYFDNLVIATERIGCS